MKSEPDVFSIDDLARDQETSWEGVRNYQARNSMRDDMKLGDRVLYYHSNADPSGIAGIAEVSKLAYPDPLQFDPTSDYYDAKSTPENPRWLMVNVRFVEKFARLLPLEELKSMAALEGMGLLQKGQRLSVMPVDKKHFDWVVKHAKKSAPKAAK